MAAGLYPLAICERAAGHLHKSRIPVCDPLPFAFTIHFLIHLPNMKTFTLVNFLSILAITSATVTITKTVSHWHRDRYQNYHKLRLL